MVYSVDDTIVAVASAPGGAARGVVRISGPAALDCVRACFRPDSQAAWPSKVATSLTGVFDLAAPIGATPCRLYLWPTARSYTRQPTAEFHLPGATPMLEAALSQCCLAGARLAEPGEFTLRAFLAGRIDLPQAEAVLGVIDATSQRQLQVALNQLAGGLSQPLNALRDQLLNLSADIEAGLDFVEEDIEFISSTEVVRQLDDILGALDDALSQIAARGESPCRARIVLRGRPNVGKSSLWNALVPNVSAITSDQPGTTRDYLEGAIYIEGLACTLIDTAGVDALTTSDLDEATQALTDDRHQEANLAILCLDGSAPLEVWDVSELMRNSPPTIVVVTKCDRPLHASLTSVDPTRQVQFGSQTNTIRILHEELTKEVPIIQVSSHRGTGLDELRLALRHRLTSLLNHESSVVAHTAARCHESLRRARLDVDHARRLAAAHRGDELVAAEIRNALNELGKVVGAVYTEDVLDRIFSRFCIGK